MFAGTDLVHHPFTVPVPTSRRVPQVRTLADVQHLDHPELFSRAERIYRSWGYDHAARVADAVLTVSEFSRDRIVQRLGIDPAQVHVTPLGVVPEHFESSPERDPVVLYPARTWPHKNHARLVEAMGLVRDDHPELRLVLTGGGTDRLPDLPDWVDARGPVSTEELRRLYARAACLAFPSLYEGFGMPPLEAMASSCPVAAAGTGAIPEVCGDAAVLFDPYDVRAIAEAIRVAITSGPVQLERGRERVRRFSWERCAEATVRAYRTLAG
jgi:glycosyltransferase involved in cell wall biosynthesis